MINRRATLMLLASVVVACQAAQPAPSTPSPSPTATPSLSPTAAQLPTRGPIAVPTTSPVASVSSTQVGSPLPSDPRTLGWRGDFEALVAIREDIHPEPWHAISRDEYVADLGDVMARIPEATNDELLFELNRLAALPNSFGRDGHGGIYPWGEGSFGVNLYPLRLYWFSDGVFVTDAMATRTELIGARVEGIAGHDIESVFQAVEPLVSRDNQQQVLSSVPLYAIVANMLHGAGLVRDSTSAVDFTFSRDGETFEAPIEPVPMEQVGSLLGGHYFWTVPRRQDGPLWLTNMDDEIWFEVLEDSDTLYVGYNTVGAGLWFDIGDLTTIVDSGDVDRLVVDLRHNGGGDNTTYFPLVDLVERAAEELPSGAYVIMGRATFSAAGNFVTETARRTNATLVGEDLGTSPNQYGDGRPTTLEHSQMVFRVASRWITRSEPDDPRLAISPDLATPLSSADYFGGRDPALEAILADR